MLRIGMFTLLIASSLFVTMHAALVARAAYTDPPATAVPTVTMTPTPAEELTLECVLEHDATLEDLVVLITELDEDEFAWVMRQVFDRLGIRKGA